MGLTGVRRNRFSACVCMTQPLWRLRDRAPPARRFAGQARSHICFGPVTPVPLHTTALFARRNIEVDAKGPRASASEIIGPKQMWERACPAKRRAGGARSHKRHTSRGEHPQLFTYFHALPVGLRMAAARQP